MAINRYYSSIAQDTTLTSSITSGATSITVSATTGWPFATYPFTLALDYNTSLEELVDVTAVTGTTVTITRGVDSTTPVAHGVGAIVRHVITARDMTEAQTHIAATTGAHGVSGTLASTDDVNNTAFMIMGA